MAAAAADVGAPDKERLIGQIFNQLRQHTFDYPSIDSHPGLYEDIRTRLEKYRTESLEQLYVALNRKQIEGIRDDDLKNIDAEISAKLVPMRRKGSGFDPNVIDRLEKNLTRIQYNTLLIICQKLKKEVIDEDQKKMLSELVELLTQKMGTLNATHDYKRGQSNILQRLALDGGAERAVMGPLLELLGISMDAKDEDLRRLLFNLTGKDMNGIIELFAELKFNEDDLANILREVSPEGVAEIRAQVDKLKEIDGRLLRSMVDIAGDDAELKGKFGLFVEQLIKLQINVIIMLCEAYVKEEGEPEKINDFLKILNEKYEELNSLHNEKDYHMNDLDRDADEFARASTAVAAELSLSRPLLPSAGPGEGKTEMTTAEAEAEAAAAAELAGAPPVPTGDLGQSGEGLRQFGGANSSYYKMKYLKYKAKYLKLRSN